MFRTKKLNPVLKATGVIGVAAGLATAVTFALLTSTATLTANTLTSDTANLFVANGAATDATTNTNPGFAITGVTPGGAASGPYSFNLKNAGDTVLGVTVYATPSAVTGGTLNNDKVHFCFTRVNGGPSTACFTRTEMLANFNTLPGGPLTADNPDTNIQYDLNVSMDADAITGSSASIAAFDLVFTGTQQ